MLINTLFTPRSPVFRTHTFPEFDLLRRQMDALFDESRAPTTRDSKGWPKAQLEDKGDALELTLAVPGVRASALEIKLADGELTVRGERAAETPEGYGALLRERAPVQFMRRFRVSPALNAEAITARYQDGVLTLTLPKKAAPVAREIPIST